MSSCESNSELIQVNTSQQSFESERSGLDCLPTSWQKSYSPVQLISGKNVLVCNAPKCSYKTDKNSNFKRHYETMHCPLNHPKACCNLRFLTKGEFRYHTKTVHCQGHRCTSCKKLFNRRALLDRHMSIHTGNKPFHCPECDYASANKANVRRHLAVHKVRGNGDNTENSTISANEKGSNCNLPLRPAVSKYHESPELTMSSSSPTSVVICLQESANLCHKSRDVENWTHIGAEDCRVIQKTTKQSISHSIEHLLSQPYKRKSDDSFIQNHENIEKSYLQNETGTQLIKNEPSPYVRSSSHSIIPNWSHTSALFSWTHFPEVHFSTQQGFPQVSGHHDQVPLVSHPTSAPMMTPQGIHDERQKQSLYECPFLPGTGTSRQSHLDLSLGLNRNEDMLYSYPENNHSSALAPHQESRAFPNNFSQFKEGKEYTEYHNSLQNDCARDCVIDYTPNETGIKGARTNDMNKFTSESTYSNSITEESHTSLGTGKSEFMKGKRIVDLMNEHEQPPPPPVSPHQFLKKCQFSGEYIHKKLRAVGKTENGYRN